MVETEDVMAFWSKIFEPNYLECLEPPELLRNLSNDNHKETQGSKILFVCRDKISEEKTVKEIPTFNSKQVRRKSQEKEDLDLTGSPLKCSFTLDEEFDDDYVISSTDKRICARNKPLFLPLSTALARSLVNTFLYRSLQEMKKTSNFNTDSPIFAFCDGTDKTLYIGAERNKNCLRHHIVKYRGLYTTKELSDGLKKFKLDHANRKVNRVEAHSVFDLMSDSCDQNLDLSRTKHDFVEGEHGEYSLKIHQKWKNPRAFLDEASLDASVNLEAKIVPGAERMATCNIFRELLCLHHFSCGLEDKGIVWRKRDEGEATLEEILMSLLDKVRNESRVRRRVKVNRPSDNTSEMSECDIESVLSGSRQDFDFIDHVWNALHRVESYDELCKCLHHIFARIKHEELRPFMYSNNSSRFEMLVNSIARGDDVPEMKGKFPLELLVEIGIEKLRRDYIHYLMSSFLATKEDLTPCMKSRSSSYSDSVSNLQKLHLVLELISLIQTFLSPGHDCLRKIVSQSLQMLKKESMEKFGKTQNFRFEILPHYVKQRLSKLNPTSWRCLVKSGENENVSMESVAYLNVDPPESFLKPDEPDLPYGDENSDKNPKYFYTVKTSITRKS